MSAPNLFEQLRELKPEPTPTPEQELEISLPQPPVMESASVSANNRPTLKIQLPALTKEEQARMNDMTLGVIVSIGVLYALAGEGGESQLRFSDSISSAFANIFETAVPATTYDVVAVALGETLAGLTGAIASLGLNLLLVNTRRLIADNQIQIQRAQSVINEAVAESDYFLARAAVLPLLEGVGLPPGIATIASSLFATFPYEVVKMGKMKRNARREENELLEQLLTQQRQIEEKARRVEQQARWNLEHLVRKLRQHKADLPAQQSTDVRALVDISTLRPIQSEEYVLDGVELFADTCKWLSYSVLMKDFSDTMEWRGLPLGSGFESGFYGLLATLTSQIYADFLYVTAAAGPQAKQDQVRARTAPEWVKLYLSKSISAFTLFGVYASVQVPVRIAVNALLSGSIDSCIGSMDMEQCIETYYTQNPPGADVGAQIRAVATTIYSFSQIPAMDYANQASFEAQVRAIVTTLVSLMNRLM